MQRSIETVGLVGLSKALADFEVRRSYAKLYRACPLTGEVEAVGIGSFLALYRQARAGDSIVLDSGLEIAV